MTFSQRMKYVPVREAIQVESLDNATRAAIWNSLLPFINAVKHDRSLKIARNIWMDLYQQPADVVPPTRLYSYENVSGEELYCRFFRQKVIEGKWYECLDFVEYVANEKRPSRPKVNERITFVYFWTSPILYCMRFVQVY